LTVGGGNDIVPFGQSMSNARVGLGDLHLSQGSSSYGLKLDSHPTAVLQTTPEMSMRRRDAVKAAFSRIDQRGMGFVSFQELQAGLQRYSNLGSADQQRVAHGIEGSIGQRVTFVQFLAYYQQLGNSIERDRDFEDLIRHHWGFPEVCDILDDMKNKFMMVGLAYTFRHGLNKGGGCPELSMETFRDAISQVGMSYNPTDIKRVFDAFDSPGGQLEVLRLTQHLTSAPKPPTPVPALYGTAHISEVGSTPNSSQSYPMGLMGLHASGKIPDPPHAPPEKPETTEQDEPAPKAPPEEEEEGVNAPHEANGGNPNEAPPQAPPEDDDDGDGVPPPENNENHKKYDYQEPCHAPMEGAAPPRYGGHSDLMQTQLPMAYHGFQGGYSFGHPSGKDPEPPNAPAETKEQDEPPPQAPPEGEDDGVNAPAEAGHHNPHELPPLAPPENDDEGDEMPPPETDNHKQYDHEPGHAPPEGYAPHRYGGYSNFPMGNMQSPMGNMQSPFGNMQSPMGNMQSPMGRVGGGHLAAAALAGNQKAAGRKKGVTVGINYIGTPNEQRFGYLCKVTHEQVWL
jgi:hypothetical protein